MTWTNRDFVMLFIALLMIICPHNLLAFPLDQLHILKISSLDGTAVIKMPEGFLRVIKPGDVIGNDVTVKEIASGRILLEERHESGTELVIVRLVNDKQLISRVRRLPGTLPTLTVPVVNK